MHSGYMYMGVCGRVVQRILIIFECVFQNCQGAVCLATTETAQFFLPQGD